MSTTMLQQFRLPDVGEGLTEAEIVTWHVAVGDVVEVNQVLVDIETAKSVVELPSPYAGEVAELLVAEGETVDVGTPIIAIGDGGRPAPDTDDEEPRLLVGYGAKEGGTRRRRRPATAAAPAPEQATTTSRPRCKPPVRRLATVMGVDLRDLVPSGPDGTIVRADVIDAARAEPDPAEQVPGETRIPVKGVRKHTAAAMVASAFTAPHVTEFVAVDVTRTMELRDAVQARREFREVKVSPLAFVARAYLLAIARTPMANARWDEEAQEIALRDDVNLGIAAATPRGLVVPNVRAAQRLGLLDLATSINELAATARAGKTPPEAMAQGTTTITNVGVFGVDSGTPILNPGETTILAVGAVRRMPWVVGTGAEERIEPRSVMQLALSFDHRVMDGQQGSELLADTAAVLQDPGLALL